ncbi:MAG: cadherin-like beta sandwich domain-containing protein, partial [bacterium]|nr:cadherin-like beta sandwich domain-containing protein [bacterium]
MKKMTRQFLLFSFFILLSFMAASCEGVSIGERIIYDDGLSSDADLTGLTVSQGTFNYPFNRYDWAYSVSVEYTVDSIKLTPTAVHKRSEISIITGEDPEGFTVESGSESKAISLDVGFNTIRIKITAQDDTARCYIVFVIRHTEAYINTELASLSISGIDLDQPFDPETTEYSATTSGSSISISAEAAGSSDGGSISYTMNGLPILDPGSIVLPAEDNVITITVTAGNGSTREYTITITVAARLAALSIEGEVLSPVFDPDSAVRVYSAELTAASINVTAEAASASDGAAVAFSMNGIPIPDPSAIDLAKGALNQLDILVTAPNGAVSESYTLNVTRLDDNPANANLAGLSLSGSGGEAVALSPAFDAGTTGYTVTMSSALNPVSLTTSAAGAGATISILLDSSPVPDAAAMTLNSGDNTLIARVTAANGSTTRDYTITVTMNMDAGLSALAFTASDLSPIALSPSFEQGVSDYTATVKAALSPISIAATAATGGATVEILLDGTPVGDPSSVSLTNETSVITARVSAGAVTKDYTITVTLRSGSDNAYLSNIVLTMGSGNTQRPLYSDFNSPGSTGFSRDTLEYAAVIYSFDTITVNATAEDSNVSAITVNGSGTVSGGS